MADKYGFDTTSLTLVEKLSRGEDWDRFCRLYHEPVSRKFYAINRKGGGLPQVDEVDEQDAVNRIFEKLKVKLQGSYDPERGRLRHWLARVIENAIHDFCAERGKQKAELVLDKPNDGGGKDGPADENGGPSAADDFNWVMYLQETAMRLALTRHPWKAETKVVIEAICKEEMKERSEQRTSDELAKSLSISAANLRKIRERFFKEVRLRFEQFKTDDPDFFAEYAKTHKIPFDESQW